jgi:L-alanine-DL-glutamate epimerase-like enolase superfamily enzyme
MNVTLTVRELHPRHVFRIARPRRNPIRNVFLKIERDGVTGYGEASPNAYYEETADSVLAKLHEARGFIASLQPRSPDDLAEIWRESWPLLRPSRAAQCARVLALWDWLARSQQRSVAALIWGAPPAPVSTFCTIGLSSPEELEAKLAELRDFPLIKIKSDASVDLTPIRYVRQHSRAIIAVDANASWSAERLPSLAADLAQLGVTFLEQPLDPKQNDQLARDGFALPIIADESCVTEDDVEQIAPHFSGFNIKLVKCGGLTPALRMLTTGRRLGLKVMVGCMLESSLLISAGAVIAQRTDFADLDGAWLLSDDPFTGLAFERGRLISSGGAVGFGVTPDAVLFP